MPAPHTRAPLVDAWWDAPCARAPQIDTEPYAKTRDAQLKGLVEGAGVEWRGFWSHTLYVSGAGLLGGLCGGEGVALALACVCRA